jgi:cytidine deaminase
MQNDYIERLQQTMQQAYAPYSQYPVAALIVTASGGDFAGCNVENASYGEGHCAETAAISAMVLAGHRRIESIYIMSQDQTGATPCGGCRQRIREFADAQTPVHLCNVNGIVHSFTLGELLPHAFGPEFLLPGGDL